MENNQTTVTEELYSISNSLTHKERQDLLDVYIRITNIDVTHLDVAIRHQWSTFVLGYCFYKKMKNGE